MTIHHGIVKKANGQGFALTQDEPEGEIDCHHIATNRHVVVDPQDFPSDNDAAKAAHTMMAEILAFETENPGWRVNQVNEDDGGFEALFEGDPRVACVNDGDIEACLAETFEQALNPNREDGEEADLDEEPEVHSVVPDRFKKLYREVSSSGQDCGDWLAGQMGLYCTKLDGKRTRVDTDAVELMLTRNGIDYAQPEYGNRGWQGRYRMTGRNMLAKVVADNAKLIVPAGLNGDEGEIELVPPSDWIAKHKTVVKVSKKAAKEAEEAAAQIASEVPAKPKRTRKAK